MSIKKTKIVCTIGPASESFETITRMAKAGMNIARLNFSHGTYDEHLERIELIRNVEKRENVNISIMLDTKGPEIRLGNFKNGQEEYEIGEEVEIVKEVIEGTHKKFTIMCPELFNDVKEGNYILINDGKMRITVLANDGNVIKGRIEVKGPLS